MSDAPTPTTPTDTAPDEPETRAATDRATYLDTLRPESIQNPGRRTSGTVEHLLIEAELVAEGKTLDNPAVPAESVMEDVLGKLEDRDLEPAWLAMRGDEE